MCTKYSSKYSSTAILARWWIGLCFHRLEPRTASWELRLLPLHHPAGSTSAAGARTPDCCVGGEKVTITFTPPSRQTGRPTAASWYRILVYFYFLIWNYRLSSWIRASWYSVLGLRSWLLPICWYIATDLLSSKLAPIVSSHCFAVLFGFILTLAVVQHQHQELSLVISVINISFKSVLKVNLFSNPWFLALLILCYCILSAFLVDQPEPMQRLLKQRQITVYCSNL